jgi:hypothetical protein
MNFRLIACRNGLFLLHASLFAPCLSSGQSIAGTDQSWEIGGSAGNILNDSGVAFIPTTDALDQGSPTLGKDLSKEGSGQLSFIGRVGDFVGTSGSPAIAGSE